MIIQCPSCRSIRVVALQNGRKVGGSVGTVAGAASGVAMATSGARVGATVGVSRELRGEALESVHAVEARYLPCIQLRDERGKGSAEKKGKNH